MSTERVLLDNGFVLATGGENFSLGNLASTEVYDPRSGTWSDGGTMQAPRRVHTETLLNDGTVLVSGGLNSPQTPRSEIGR